MTGWNRLYDAFSEPKWIRTDFSSAKQYKWQDTAHADLRPMLLFSRGEYNLGNPDKLNVLTFSKIAHQSQQHCFGLSPALPCPASTFQPGRWRSKSRSRLRGGGPRLRITVIAPGRASALQPWHAAHNADSSAIHQPFLGSYNRC